MMGTLELSKAAGDVSETMDTSRMVNPEALTCMPSRSKRR